MTARQIATVKDLEALPIGAILVDGVGETERWKRDAWQKVDRDCYWRVGDRKDFDAAYVARRGPLLCVWTPETAAPAVDCFTLIPLGEPVLPDTLGWLEVGE